MKKLHILGIVVIAISIGVILSTISDASTYVDFNQAAERPNTEFQVIGILGDLESIHYDPAASPYFSFSMIDELGEQRTVKFKGSKPQDFERSDQIVITGHMEEQTFIASKILMKCPSKYNEGGEVEVVSQSES